MNFKYEAGELHGRLLEESRFEWQFPATYKTTAVQSEFETQELKHDVVLGSEPYDLSAAWTRMRKHHANQCLEFIKAHSIVMMQQANDATSEEAILREMTTDVRAELQKWSFYNAYR
eukprot:TRINITY_DN104453_c0_g1_i1.p1 TRINITY_DN104453_c0_g1~~TRINITY_DN104453_c0_g1_i1.p1  ORF type:complete len:117 (+),score=17.65 TRINITY_DN104453_c0_g1_i1:524-874(+)